MGVSVVRLLQKILLMIGAPALGVLTCGMGLACISTVTLFRPRQGSEPGLNWGAAIGFMGCGACGSVFGIIVGLYAAIRWINLRGNDRWTPTTWVGIGLGLAVALAIRFSESLDRFGLVGDLINWWVGTIIFVTAIGTLGGLLGGIVAGSSPMSGKKQKGRRRKRVQDFPD